MQVLGFFLIAAASGASPIARVVELLSNLKAKIIADGSTEQTLFDKYACWCDETTARKASSIEEGKASIESLSQTILELSAAQGSSGATLKKLAKDIAANQASAKEADALRDKERAAYIAEKGELEQNVANLEKAINVLAKGTTGFTPAMVETQSLTIAAGVRSALKLYEQDPENKGQDMSAVGNFLRDPAAWVQTASSTQGLPHVKSYNHQSGAIQGILQEMFDTFKRDLGTAYDEEQQKIKDHEALKATKATELALLVASQTKQTTQSGDDSKALQEAKIAREETDKALRADEEFFSTMKAGCRQKANEWADRSRVRTEELGGIAQAVDILSSEHATATFENATSTFIQLHSSGSRSRGPRDWAFTALKKAATPGTSTSIRLATLATKVYLAAQGHFDEVISEIDGMVKVLRDEERSDVERRDYCQTERSNADSKTEALEYDMTELSNKVARLENKVSEVEADKTKTETEMSDLENAMKAALEQRNAENAAFQQAMSDDLESISLIQQAITALAPKYGAGQASLVAVKKDAPQDSPPETWGNDYEGRKSEGTGIIAILNMIAEDLQKDITTAKRDEAASLAEYEKLRAESNAGLSALDEKKSGLEQQLADLNEEMAQTERMHLDKESLGNETSAYLSDLAGSCDGILAQFESRASQRKDEMSGLQNAKSILLGAGYDDSADQPTSSGLAPSAKLVAVKTAPTAANSYAESVDAQLRDLDSDALSFNIPSSFLQQRRH